MDTIIEIVTETGLIMHIIMTAGLIALADLIIREEKHK